MVQYIFTHFCHRHCAICSIFTTLELSCFVLEHHIKKTDDNIKPIHIIFLLVV
ncbi:MAG: hypothetical protein WCG25_03900 [bacterium]